ncbi:MAG TPA: hypothetical protein VJU78_18825 [Chitinophagaceae bacterium]|nr:hypothetical protein [Chitinophagaceae bacterium]
MKVVLVILIMLLAGLPGQSQLKGFSLGPFAEAGWPVGSFKETNKNGYGAGLGADIRLGKIGLSGSVGYMHFGGKTIFKEEEGLVDMPSVNAVPVRVGLKYRISPALYAKMESGVAKFTGGNQSAVILSPGIGVRVLGFDFQAKYEVWKNEQTYSFWGLKAGINF